MGPALFLIYAQLPAYMIHQYEEHADGRFKAFANNTFGGGREVMTDKAIFWINVGGVWGIDLAAIGAAELFGMGWGLVAAYLPLVNAISHIGAAIRFKGYNPGLWTSVVLFLPLSLFAVDCVPATAMQHATGFGLSILIHTAIAGHIVRRVKLLARRG